MNLEIKLDEMARDIAMRAMDEATYEGKTMREWINLIKMYTKGKGDLISRSALIEILSRNSITSKVIVQDKTILQHIEDAPALYVQPVVLCDDCYWRSATGYCRRYGHSAPDGFFCADGRKAIFTDKRPEKKTEERCGGTGLPCSRCVPGPCDHRRMVIPDDSGQ